jgi:hypothetical protein
LQDNLLWACLAGTSMAAKELNMAEVAYAALDEVDMRQPKTQMNVYLKYKTARSTSSLSDGHT